MKILIGVRTSRTYLEGSERLSVQVAILLYASPFLFAAVQHRKPR